MAENQKPKSKKKRVLREIGELVLALFVAWLGYQALALATGTSLPIVAVVSDSMYHNGNFDEWWASRGKLYESIGITKEEFKDFPFRNGLSVGDFLLVINSQPQIGDVIIYDRPVENKGYITIVHRLVETTNGEYVTKGDNNLVKDSPIAKNQIRGKVVLAVPLLGYPRFLLFAFGI